MDMTKIENIRIQRRTKPEGTIPGSKPKLVTFSDGNQEAYGCVAYALWKMLNRKNKAVFLMAKAKIGPLTSNGDVVRMELSAATDTTRLQNWIKTHSRLD